MKVLDIILLIPLLYGAYKGFGKGLVKEFGGFLIFVLAIILGFKFINLAIEQIRPYITEESILPFAAFFAIFLVILVVGNMLVKLFRKLVHLTPLGLFDDLGGALFGALKWLTLFSIGLWLIHESSLYLPGTWTSGTVLYPYYLKAGPFILNSISNLVPYCKTIVEDVQAWL